MDISIFKDCKGTLKFGYKLAHLTWLKVGGKAEIFYKPSDLQDLQTFLSVLPTNYELNTIGAGSNLLIRDKGVKGAVVKLGPAFNYIRQDGDTLISGAGTLNSSLAQFCLENQIGSFEFLAGIPGSIGGGISMNAGAYSKEFKDIISSVIAVKRDGSLAIFTNEQMGFKYRSHNIREPLVFVEARFKVPKNATGVSPDIIKAKIDQINTARRLSQPVKQKTAGSTFKNPSPEKAWQLIDEVGMRGFTIGGAQISDMHCNFLINLGNATAKDLEEVAETAREKVYRKKGIRLEWEVKRIGEK